MRNNQVDAETAVVPARLGSHLHCDDIQKPQSLESQRENRFRLPGHNFVDLKMTLINQVGSKDGSHRKITSRTTAFWSKAKKSGSRSVAWWACEDPPFMRFQFRPSSSASVTRPRFPNDNSTESPAEVAPSKGRESTMETFSR